MPASMMTVSYRWHPPGMSDRSSGLVPLVPACSRSRLSAAQPSNRPQLIPGPPRRTTGTGVSQLNTTRTASKKPHRHSQVVQLDAVFSDAVSFAASRLEQCDIHRRFRCCRSRSPGARPRQISSDDVAFIVATGKGARSPWVVRSPTGRSASWSSSWRKTPRTRWRSGGSGCKLERTTFQRTETSKDSNDPLREEKPDRIEEALDKESGLMLRIR